MKLKASTKKVKTLNTVKSYMEIQVPRNIALYHAIYGTAGLMQLIEEGKERFKTDDRNILSEYQTAYLPEKRLSLSGYQNVARKVKECKS